MHPSHRQLVAVIFALLGLHVGVRAVQLADVTLRLDLTAAQLGASASVAAIAGIVTLVAGAMLVDRVGRRPMLALGLVGSGATFLANAAVTSYVGFLAVCLGYGLLISFLDLAANTIGSDLERLSGEEGMSGFHSWFSLAAAVGALLSAAGLAAGTGFRLAFTLLGAAMVIGGVWAVLQELPSVVPDEHHTTPSSGATARTALPLGVLLAVGIVFCCFFGDGILETFLSVLVRADTTAPVWMAGITLAVFHLASWLGRTLTQRVVRRVRERTVLVVAGLFAAASMGASLWLVDGWWAAAGFALVGFALSPIVPLGMSLAGRLAPAGSEGQAIGVTNAVGYSAFVASPAAAGTIADVTSLTVGVGVAALTMLGVSLLALLLPRRP